jgi:alcohol/geraniol dehydrogenase (NADP+)
MSDSEIMGYIALEPGAELTPFSYESPPLKKNEVRIAITHCGLCGSDIQAIDDVYSVFKFPFMPGHEIVGYITEIGSDVKENRLGERVGVGWQGRSCGHCDWCNQGDVQLCMDVVNNGTWTPYGGFSTSITVQDDFAYSLPAEMSSEVAAVLMCAGFTVYSALSRNYLSPSQKIGIIGIGGLGHLAIQYAKAMGYEVTAISSSLRKREEAIELGAQRFLNVNDHAALRKLEFYYDLLYITAHGGIAWEEMLEMLRKRGKVILSGFPEINVGSVDIVSHELIIVGSFLGTQEEMREMLKFSVAHKIQPMIEVMPMSKVNQAIEKLRQNKAHYRIVFVNDIV